MKKILMSLGIVLVLCLLAFAAFRWRIQSRVEGDYFDSEGLRLHYTDQGKGVPVILLHGFAVNPDINWRRCGVIDRLSKKFRVIALDHRGHGLSDKPHDPKAYGQKMVEDVIRLMDHLDLEKAHVVGYSMGGYITLQLMLRHPERLLSAVPCASGWSKEGDRTAQVLPTLIRSLEAGKGIEPIARMLRPAGHSPSKLQIALVNRVLTWLNDQQALAHVVRGWREFVLSEDQLRKNTIPAFTIVGSEDPIRKGVDNLIGVLPHHQVLVIDGANHMDALSYPEFGLALENFLMHQ